MKRFGKVAAGFGLILGGIPLLVLPGPGLLTIFAGISLIASEFIWASNVSVWAKRQAARLGAPESSPPVDAEDQTG